MDAKCEFCTFFGKKQHCHNCRIINNSREFTPKEIDCSLSEFIEIVNTSINILEHYNIGDYKYIKLITGERVKLVILDSNKDKLAYEPGSARVTLGIFSLYGAFQMNTNATNQGGWEHSEMRTIGMERFLRLLPEELRDAIKPVIKKTSIGSISSEICSTVDKCFLFSEVELRGKTEYSYSEEGDQYEYFANETIGLSNYQWLRSPSCYNNHDFCVFGSSTYSYQHAYLYRGVSLGFCI